MAEDCPRNAIELHNLISDFITDGMVYTEDEAFKICEVIAKILIDKKLVIVEQRDTIVAEKLQNPVVLNQVKAGGVASGVIRDEDFLDPFTGIDRTKANQNSQFESGKLVEAAEKNRKKMQDALDKKIAEFM